jgi:hypothetical protein
MALTARGTDRFSFGVLYLLVGLLALWMGFRIINSGLEIRFLKDYLLQWESDLNAFTVQEGILPVFTGNNHTQYMDSLTLSMTQAGLDLPHSNTQVNYRYRVERFGDRSEEIFVLCLHDRMVLYGLSAKTLRSIDKALDGSVDLTRGRVSGRPGISGKTYIGQVRL